VAHADLVGAVLDGRYKVLEPVAEGAMGVVYRAERVKLGRVVAVKVLHDQLPNELSSRQRFEIEAMAMAKLEHPHCAAVLDVGTHDGRPFVVMDYVTGQDLKSLILDGPVPAERAVEIVRQVLSGLAHAHELGIIHRDVKPANIMLSQKAGLGDHVTILDFGLARLQAEKSSGLTTGIVVGTPAYMAPEQIRGTKLDARVDVYACGVLLMELLTGQKPFHSPKDDPIEVVQMHLKKPPPRLGDLAPGRDFGELEAIVARALAKNADERYQSATEFAAVLEAWGRSASAPPPEPSQQISDSMLIPQGGTRIGMAAVPPSPSLGIPHAAPAPARPDAGVTTPGLGPAPLPGVAPLAPSPSNAGHPSGATPQAGAPPGVSPFATSAGGHGAPSSSVPFAASAGGPGATGNYPSGATPQAGAPPGVAPSATSAGGPGAASNAGSASGAAPHAGGPPGVAPFSTSAGGHGAPSSSGPFAASGGGPGATGSDPSGAALHAASPPGVVPSATNAGVPGAPSSSVPFGASGGVPGAPSSSVPFGASGGGPGAPGNSPSGATPHAGSPPGASNASALGGAAVGVPLAAADASASAGLAGTTAPGLGIAPSGAPPAASSPTAASGSAASNAAGISASIGFDHTAPALIASAPMPSQPPVATGPDASTLGAAAPVTAAPPASSDVIVFPPRAPHGAVITSSPDAPTAPVFAPPGTAAAPAASRPFENLPFTTRQLAIGGGGALALIVLVALLARGGDDTSKAPSGGSAGSTTAADIELEPVEDGAAKVLAEAEALIANDQREAALGLLNRARKDHPDNAQLPYLAGKLYFEKLWWTDGLKQFREAIRIDPTFRSDPELIKTVLKGFITTPSYNRDLANFLREDIGPVAESYLEETARDHPNAKTRSRAAQELERYR